MLFCFYRLSSISTVHHIPKKNLQIVHSLLIICLYLCMSKQKNMKTRTQILNGKTYRFFFDTYIKSWTVYQIDSNGYQVSDADHFSNKEQMLKMYNFKLK